MMIHWVEKVSKKKNESKKVQYAVMYLTKEGTIGRVGGHIEYTQKQAMAVAKKLTRSSAEQ